MLDARWLGADFVPAKTKVRRKYVGAHCIILFDSKLEDVEGKFQIRICHNH